MNSPQIQASTSRIVSPNRKCAPPPQFEIFKLAERNALLAKQGYVIFPFLDDNAVADLRAFYAAHHAATPQGFYATAHSDDLAFRKSMNDQIKAVFEPFMERDLDKFRALGGSFIAKPGGGKGILPPHADWNITTEDQFRSYNLWVPLVDTTVKNGAVMVLPFSHDWFDSVRGPGIPNAFAPVAKEIWDYMLPLEMKAGEALLYDHRLVHASPVNQTEELRLACVFGLLPEGAEMRYFYQQEAGIEAFRSNIEFHLQQRPEEGPGDLESLGMLNYDYPEVSLDVLQGFLKGRAPEMLMQSAPESIDDQRGFWQVYTPANIVREVASRIRNLFK